VDQRTWDLLVCEHLALQTLANAGALPKPYRDGGGPRVSESSGLHRTRGRIGMVSLSIATPNMSGNEPPPPI
jgi:hypothetical protein